jgi:hypothetical protein
MVLIIPASLSESNEANAKIRANRDYDTVNSFLKFPRND